VIWLFQKTLSALFATPDMMRARLSYNCLVIQTIISMRYALKNGWRNRRVSALHVGHQLLSS